MSLWSAAAFVDVPGLQLHMAHELAGALQQAGRIRQRCAVKEPHVYVRSEYIYVAEGRISQTCNRTAVMQELPDFVPAFSHHLKPLMRYGSQFTCMLFHPRIDGGIPLDSAVESQQFRSHHRSALARQEVRFRGGSVLRFDLGSEGLGYYLPVPHNKRVGSEFVRIVCCFCSPENIRVITLNASLLHRERGARLCKLRNEGLKEGLDRVWTS